ncbi:MAG: hypothetical protein WA151_05700, partial [Desulfatirhabdiaceae bacterium]
MKRISTTDIQHRILETVENSPNRLTVTDIMRLLVDESIDRKAVRNSLKRLMVSDELSFSCLHGHTFVEKSFFHPVRLSRHVLV